MTKFNKDEAHAIVEDVISSDSTKKEVLKRVKDDDRLRIFATSTLSAAGASFGLAPKDIDEDNMQMALILVAQLLHKYSELVDDDDDWKPF